ncbi:uncharacterized protein LOC131306650 isoform X1 [Rhododendron vialii]|uniref:uncharacterized protein LOC131306650 isoform X1 n=1 Tax=Rhododendron vialii TaxID=182163 RepID=UPI00265E617E|nr:uncharacterized protein LOC131306650 isoform X1 [Rhododendron vialii]XP_058189018.1 uncharacterized protein LOC131306650 isoform X1 [Rhododendron vialii]
MAAQAHEGEQPTNTAELSDNQQQTHEKLLTSYLGLTFAVYLGLTRSSSLSSLQSRNRDLCLKLIEAEEQLRQLRSRRKEDSKANARVVEIFASQRHAWRREEERLLRGIDAAAEEIARLRERAGELESSDAELRREVEELRREVGEREEMLNFVTRQPEFEEGGRWCSEAAVEAVGAGFGEFRVSEGVGGEVGEEGFLEREGYGGVEEMGAAVYGDNDGFSSELRNSASKFWAERASVWQDVQYESLESLCHLKHFASRRESPWKLEGEASGVSSKLKLLEQELLNLERIGKSDLSKVPSKMRKQTRRYQTLAGKIDNLCRRMQASDPTLSSELRAQRQTEFLIEALRLQQRASETGQKLMALQTETGKGYFGDDMESQAKLTTRRCLDSIKNNFKEIQRNLEIWLARIVGDVEGILARDGASRVKEYYVSRSGTNPFKW